MGSRINNRGITVTLYQRVESGADPFGAPVVTEEPVEIRNVLVSPTTISENLEIVNLYGKKAVYTLAIPKGDTHIWEDCRVSFFGKDWHVFGFESEGIEDLVPLDWNRKVQVERYG